MSEHNKYRPEFICEQTEPVSGVVQKPLTTLERLSNQSWLRKCILLIALACIWQVYAASLNNPLIFPTFTATMLAFSEAIVKSHTTCKT